MQLYFNFSLFFFKCIYVDVCLRNVNQYYREKKRKKEVNPSLITYSVLSKHSEQLFSSKRFFRFKPKIIKLATKSIHKNYLQGTLFLLHL